MDHEVDAKFKEIDTRLDRVEQRTERHNQHLHGTPGDDHKGLIMKTESNYRALARIEKRLEKVNYTMYAAIITYIVSQVLTSL